MVSALNSRNGLSESLIFVLSFYESNYWSMSEKYIPSCKLSFRWRNLPISLIFKIIAPAVAANPDSVCNLSLPTGHRNTRRQGWKIRQRTQNIRWLEQESPSLLWKRYPNGWNEAEVAALFLGKDRGRNKEESGQMAWGKKKKAVGFSLGYQPGPDRHEFQSQKAKQSIFLFPFIFLFF